MSLKTINEKSKATVSTQKHRLQQKIFELRYEMKDANKKSISPQQPTSAKNKYFAVGDQMAPLTDCGLG